MERVTDNAMLLGDVRKGWVAIALFGVIVISSLYFSLAIGVTLVAISVWRSAHVGALLGISWLKTKRPDLKIGTPVVVQFNAGEGYPSDICFYTAFRILESKKLRASAFPVHMDNVFPSSMLAIEALENLAPDCVYSHPLSPSSIFACDVVWRRQMVSLAAKLVCWTLSAIAGVFLTVAQWA